MKEFNEFCKEKRVLFYVEPYLSGGEYKEKHTLIADWYVYSEEQLRDEMCGMAIATRVLKYKKFRIAAYGAETNELITTCQ